MGPLARLRRIYSFDYMSHKYLWFTISGTIIAIGLISMFVRGGGNPLKGFNYGLEFRSGTRIQVTFVRPTSTGQVRAVVGGQGYADAVVQQLQSGHGESFQISTTTLSADQQLALQNALNRKFEIAPTSNGGADWNVNTVGATFSREIITSSYKAIVIALILILVYVSLRFSWKFAIGAIAAEFHDLFVVIGIYSLTGRQVTTDTIAAVLTILGYSLYDTVIVFDRIRENGPKMTRVTYGDMVNRSIWETLTRSINTTLMTLIPVICLLLFGGSTLKDFAFALLVGVASGAYSSIFIASPVLTLLKEREPRYRKLAAKASEPA
jgi:SecD/SecF fusion protein